MGYASLFAVDAKRGQYGMIALTINLEIKTFVKDEIRPNS